MSILTIFKHYRPTAYFLLYLCWSQATVGANVIGTPYLFFADLVDQTEVLTQGGVSLSSEIYLLGIAVLIIIFSFLMFATGRHYATITVKRAYERASDERMTELIKKICHNQALFGALSRKNELLFSSREIEQIVPEVLQIMGEATLSHKLIAFEYIFSPSPELDYYEMQSRYDWCEPGKFSRPGLNLGDFNLSEVNYGPWMRTFNAGRCVVVDVSELSADLRPEWIAQGIRSALICPIICLGQLHGAVAFCDCLELRSWSEEECGILTAAVADLSAIYTRRESERKLTWSQLQLETSEKKYCSIMRNIREVIFQTDSRGKLVFLNPVWTDLSQYPVEDSQGRLLAGFIHPEDQSKSEELLKQLLENVEEFFQVEVRLLLEDKSERWVEIFARQTLNSNGEILGISGSIRDISERRIYEEQLKSAIHEAEIANKAKSEFLTTMSHEIRTPLNGVIGMSGVLLETQLTDPQREYVEMILTSGDTLLNIINDILDFSKIEAGKLVVEKVQFELHQCIENAIKLVAVKAQEKGLDIAYNFQPDVPWGVIGDSIRIQQILVNLVANAVKFTHKGDIVVDVSLESMPSHETCKLLFSIKDKGIGIPANKRDLLFESFRQVDASTTRQYGGTGLGLAISCRLIEIMGGQLWVESEEHIGSNFMFCLEVGMADVGASLHLLSNNPLIADRNFIVCHHHEPALKFMVYLIEHWGGRPHAVQSCEAVLSTLDQSQNWGGLIIELEYETQLRDPHYQLVLNKCQQHNIPMMLQLPAGANNEGFHLINNTQCIWKPFKLKSFFDGLIDMAVEENPEIQTPLEPKGLLAESKPLKILLAEDNIVNQKVIETILNRLGYTIDLANNGLEALHACEVKKYDVIFMDIQMPVKDGLEASRNILELAQNNPELCWQPWIIIVTANAIIDIKEACARIGTHDFLSKPVKIDDIKNALERVPCPSNHFTEVIK